jgi:SAM-dependent methyltransferase
MDREYGKRYAELYRHHWWWRAREHAVIAEIRRLRSGAPTTRILDVGCGDGLFFDALRTFGVVEGIEPDSSLVGTDSRWADAIVRAPFDEGFSPSRRYGLILFLDVLEHMPDPIAALRQARQLLEPDGAIVITVPAFQWLWTSHDVLNQHHTRYTRRRLREIASQAGVRPVRERYLFQGLVPAKLLLKAWEKVRRPSPAPPRTPPEAVNRLLLSYSLQEARLAAALRPPFGGTLFTILVPGREE